MRRALSEPSIGSITTLTSPPPPKETSPRSSETATKEAPAAGQRLELGEDLVLAAAVDHQGVVAPLADALVRGALLDPAHLARRSRCWAATMRRQIAGQSAPSASSAPAVACSVPEEMALMLGARTRGPGDRNRPVALRACPPSRMTRPCA